MEECFVKYISIVLLLMATFSANAQLFDRGNGVIYDSDYKITWLADANYAVTAEYNALEVTEISATREEIDPGVFAGQFTYDEAMTWVGQLNYQGITGWRLPSHYINPKLNVSVSEVAHITDFVKTNPTIIFFDNIQTTMYWSKDEYVEDTSRAWMTFLNYFNGNLYAVFDDYHQYKLVGNTCAWAVIDGDVGGCPITSSKLVFCTSLSLVVFNCKTCENKGIIVRFNA